MNTKEKLKEIIDASLLKQDIKDVNYIIEIPNDKKNGDFSSNVAMEITRVLRKNPREIANNIVTNIDKNNIIDKVEVAGPGFINFYSNANNTL